jgi:hypothetical protein
MDAFLPRATKCLDGARNPGTIRLDMVVACDGRVARVQQIGDSGYPAPIVECITNVLHYVPVSGARRGGRRPLRVLAGAEAEIAL